MWIASGAASCMSMASAATQGSAQLLRRGTILWHQTASPLGQFFECGVAIGGVGDCELAWVSWPLPGRGEGA
jgi:hypothetical protein